MNDWGHFWNRKRQARHEAQERDETDLDDRLEDGFSLLMDDDDERDDFYGLRHHSNRFNDQPKAEL